MDENARKPSGWNRIWCILKVYVAIGYFFFFLMISKEALAHRRIVYVPNSNGCTVYWCPFKLRKYEERNGSSSRYGEMNSIFNACIADFSRHCSQSVFLSLHSYHSVCVCAWSMASKKNSFEIRTKISIFIHLHILHLFPSFCSLVSCVFDWRPKFKSPLNTLGKFYYG